MPKPNLFLFGAAKCGTTSLHTYLEQHPEICMSRVKEPHHFGSDLNLGEGWHIPDRSEYEAMFDGAESLPRRGESSVFYMISENAAREVADYADGDARVIAMLRDPVSAVWSLHWQFIKSANEDIEDLAAALDAEADRAEGRRIPPSVHNAQALRYINTYSYEPHLRRIIDAFGRDRVHIELFEDLKSDPAALYRRVLGFLGVDESFAPEFEVVNPAVPVRNLALRRALARAPKLKKLWGKVPNQIRGGVGKTAASMLGGDQTRPPLKPDTRARLVDTFSNQIESIEQLLGRDLNVWRDAWNRST